MGSDWADNARVASIGLFGFGVTVVEINEFLKLSIAACTLAYMLAKALSAWRLYINKKDDENSN